MKKERAKNNVIIVEIEKEFINTWGYKLLTPSKGIRHVIFLLKVEKVWKKIQDFLDYFDRQRFDRSLQQIISWKTTVIRHYLSDRFGK